MKQLVSILVLLASTNSWGAELRQVGWDGYLKSGHWAPVLIEKQESPSLDLISQDPDGDLVVYAPQDESSPWRYFRVSSPQYRLLLRDREQSQIVARHQGEASNSASSLWLLIGFPNHKWLNPDSTQIVNVSDPKLLPDDWRGFEAADLILLSGTTTGESITDQISESAQRAILDWVRTGGHLVISLGSDQGGPKFLKQLPFKITEKKGWRQFDSLLTYGKNTTPLRLEEPVPGVRITTESGVALVSDLDDILLWQTCLGSGRLSVLTADLTDPALAGWNEIPNILRRLQRKDQEQVEKNTEGSVTRVGRSGISDLSTQLQLTLLDFRGVTRTGTWLVLLVIVAFGVLVGPLDYVMVTRWFQRPSRTWITFPLLVGLFTLGLVYSAGRLNSRKIEVNQLDLIDVDVAGNSLVGRSLISLYSPESKRYELELAPPPEFGQVEHRAHSWLALPEKRIGGTDRSEGLQFTSREYQAGESLSSVPIPVWSSKSFLGEYLQSGRSLVEVSLESTATGQLKGTLRHELPGNLSDVVLAFNNRIYIPTRGSASGGGVLPARVTWQIGSPGQSDHRELRAMLTKTRVKTKKEREMQEYFQEQAPYDPFNTDTVDIIRIISFHQATGGTPYTGLKHEQFRQWDLSSVIRVDRAVLVGRMEGATTKLQIDGETVVPDRSESFFRLILPVKIIKLREQELQPLIKEDE